MRRRENLFNAQWNRLILGDVRSLRRQAQDDVTLGINVGPGGGRC